MLKSQIPVKDVVKKHKAKRENLLPILQEIVRERSYLSETTMSEIAEELNMSSAEVFGVASFYSFLATEPLGENVIRICKTIACDMEGKEEIIKALEAKLRIKCGETTPDNKFSLMTTNCIGWCHKGPAMLVNDDVYTELTPEKAVKIIDNYLKE